MSDATTARMRFLDAYKQEHARTLKVLYEFPPERSDFRPHAKSNTALSLAWTFVVEERLMLRTLKGEPVLDGGFPPVPETWGEMLDAYEKGEQPIVDAANNGTSPNLEGTSTFFVGPKTMGEIPNEQFLKFMLDDQIHHRGQLSVYVRMVGGKVPSIYGPSADEPWN